MHSLPETNFLVGFQFPRLDVGFIPLKAKYIKSCNDVCWFNGCAKTFRHRNFQMQVFNCSPFPTICVLKFKVKVHLNRCAVIADRPILGLFFKNQSLSMGKNMLHELIQKGTMILDESNLAKSPDSKSMESIVQIILLNHYFNPILTFIHNTQKKRMCFNLMIFQICFSSENVVTLLKNPNRGGGCS